MNLGPNVGDITAGRKPAYLGRVNFISSSRVLKPKKTDEGLRPGGGLRPEVINRRCNKTCSGKPEFVYNFVPFREGFSPAHKRRSERCNGCMCERRIAELTTGKMLGCMR